MLKINQLNDTYNIRNKLKQIILFILYYYIRKHNVINNSFLIIWNENYLYIYAYFIDLKSLCNWKHKLCFEIWTSIRWEWTTYNTQYTNQSYSNGFLTIIGYAIKQMLEFFVRSFNGKRLFFITYRYSLFFNTIFRIQGMPFLNYCHWNRCVFIISFLPIMLFFSFLCRT